MDRKSAYAALENLAWGDLDVLHPAAQAEASAPFGPRTGTEVATLWQDLRRALPDMERRDGLFLAGDNRPDSRWTAPRAPHLVACCGAYLGTFRESFAGIPPTGGVVTLPYGEAHYFEDGRLKTSWLLWDLVALMQQAGVWPMARPTGARGHWPAPKGGQGLRLDDAPPSDSLARVLAMHDALHAFDGKDLDSMPMHHWAQDFSYWAGGNIGACRGLSGFRAHHQIPFLRAFPDRRGAGHFVRLSDGPFAVTGGDVALTHTGADYMGVPATGRKLTFRVMDFYRFGADGLIAENWLPNDTIGLLEQMGIDVMARLAHLTGQPRQTL